MKQSAFLFVLALVSCGGKVPPIRYYELDLAAAPLPVDKAAESRPKSVRPVLAIEQFATDTAYDDNRIVYRESSVRLDYYFYHRWTALPGTMIADEMRSAYEKTGRFAAVVEGITEEAAVVLSGRITALEEVDLSPTAWQGRLRLNLQLRNAKSGALLWSRTMEEQEPMRVANQEALARAISAALARVVARTAAEFAAIAERRTAAPASSSSAQD